MPNSFPYLRRFSEEEAIALANGELSAAGLDLYDQTGYASTSEGICITFKSGSTELVRCDDYWLVSIFPIEVLTQMIGLTSETLEPALHRNAKSSRNRFWMFPDGIVSLRKHKRAKLFAKGIVITTPDTLDLLITILVAKNMYRHYDFFGFDETAN